MVRLVITNFVGNGPGAIGCHGFYHNAAVYSTVSVDGIEYDPTILTTVREQILSGVVQKFNESKGVFGLQNESDVIVSDVEVMC